MARLLLRLLVIVSLVANGAAPSWAMGGNAHAHHGEDAMHAEAGATPAPAEHRHATHEHAAASGARPAHVDHEVGPDPQPAPVDHAVAADAASLGEESCCGEADCQCGCVLPPMLSTPSFKAATLAWNAVPAAEPGTRALTRRLLPPLRPPAA